MGFGGKEKNLAEQLKESQARASELEGQLSAAQAQVSDATAKIGELEGQVAQKQQDLDAAAAKATEAAQALAAAEDRATKAEAKSVDLEKKLASPGDAYTHASPGRAKPVAEGVAEAGESVWEKYYAIKSPKERTIFWRDNSEALQKESAKREGNK